MRAATKSDWSVIMYNSMRAFHPVVCLLFILTIFIGGFFGFNMIIAVLKVYYSQTFEEI